MTPQHLPTTRGEIAIALARGIEIAAGDPEALRSALYVADRHLHRLGFTADRHWLCEHFGHVRLTDAEGLAVLAQRLRERLTIEGEALPVITGRTLDALTADAKRHLAVSGDRRDFAGHLLAHSGDLTIEQHLEQMALLLTDASYRLAGIGDVVEEPFRLRAQVELAEARADGLAARLAEVTEVQA